MIEAVSVLIAAVALCMIMVGLGGWQTRAGHGTVSQTVIRSVLVVAGIIALLLSAALFAAGRPVHGRDLGQWTNADPAIRAWYRSLMQPDNPNASCCGEADAYWADEVHVRNGRTFVTITDDRDDTPLGRPHIPNGTVIEVPDHKLKWDRGNPTGHGVIFLSRSLHVFCYVQPGGT